MKLPEEEIRNQIHGLWKVFHLTMYLIRQSVARVDHCSNEFVVVLTRQAAPSSKHSRRQTRHFLEMYIRTSVLDRGPHSVRFYCTRTQGSSVPFSLPPEIVTGQPSRGSHILLRPRAVKYIQPHCSSGYCARNNRKPFNLNTRELLHHLNPTAEARPHVCITSVGKQPFLQNRTLLCFTETMPRTLNESMLGSSAADP